LAYPRTVGAAGRSGHPSREGNPRTIDVVETLGATAATELGRRTFARAPAPVLILAAAFSVQSGAALATTLFDDAGTPGTVFVRTGFAALILLIAFPGALRRRRWGPLRFAMGLGVSLACVNSLFYAAIARAPLGIAVTVEFLGPLAVAVAGSRRRLDFLWILLAGGGVALLGSPTVDVDRAGLLLALAAGFFWATYIVIGKRLGATWPLGDGLALAMAIAAVLVAPAGLVSGGAGLFAPRLLALGLAVAVLASVVPYVLELAALRRLKTSTFGILMSLGPAVAALAGALFLSQKLGGLELVAIACVVVASIGANRDARTTVPGEP
jgi:inner membrane transporter RhtA